jgi:hypothetical protein
MISISTLVYILDLWTTSLRIEIGFKPNTSPGYQFFLTKRTWSVLIMPSSKLSENWKTQFSALVWEKVINWWDSGWEPAWKRRWFSPDSWEPTAQHWLLLSRAKMRVVEVRVGKKKSGKKLNKRSVPIFLTMVWWWLTWVQKLNEKSHPIQWTKQPSVALVGAGSLWPHITACPTWKELGKVSESQFSSQIRLLWELFDKYGGR